MTLTFISPEWATKTRDLWKKYKAPCVLRKTEDPCVCYACVRRGVKPIISDLFVVNACFDPSCHKKIKKELLSSYSPEEKKQLLDEVAKYDYIINIAKKEYGGNPI